MSAADPVNFHLITCVIDYCTNIRKSNIYYKCFEMSNFYGSLDLSPVKSVCAIFATWPDQIHVKFKVFFVYVNLHTCRILLKAKENVQKLSACHLLIQYSIL